MNSISPITTGIDGRVTFSSSNNEKSAGSNINTSNYKFIIITFITTVFFLTFKTI